MLVILMTPTMRPLSRRQTRRPRLVGCAQRASHARYSAGVAGAEHHGRCRVPLRRTDSRNSRWSAAVGSRRTMRERGAIACLAGTAAAVAVSGADLRATILARLPIAEQQSIQKRVRDQAIDDPAFAQMT